MDIVFAFIQPYVDFCINNYWLVFILIFLFCITVGIILSHLKIIDPSLFFTKGDSFLSFSTTTVFVSFFWPLVLVIVFVLSAIYFYYVIIGLIVKIVLKRIS